VKILIDMNLSPDWVKVLQKAGWEAIHWSTVGDMRAADEIIMSFARENGYIVLHMTLILACYWL
jgi:predicted nuclease of predicted toxin-antitoxin system